MSNEVTSATMSFYERLIWEKKTEVDAGLAIAGSPKPTRGPDFAWEPFKHYGDEIDLMKASLVA